MKEKDVLSYDILVVGGGIAGSMAAVAAARHKKRVLLVEETGCLGGSLTTCGTGPMMTFHAGDKQVIKGLGEELVSRLVEKNLSPGHTTDSTGYTYTVTPFDMEGMKRELELMVMEAGADLLFHASLCDMEVSGKTASKAVFASCGRMIEVSAKVFIDATGDAVLCRLADVPTQSGRASDGKNQPMTMNFRLAGVDIDLIRALMEKDVTVFPFLKNHEKGYEKKASRLSCSGFEAIMKAGIDSGELDVDRDIVLFFEDNNKNEVIVNMSRINNLDPLNPYDLTKAEIEGRRQVWKLYEYLKKHIPGFKDSTLLYSGPKVGIRSSGRMVGCYSITAKDIIEEKKFEDGIACCGYPIDIHSADGVATNTTFLRDGGYYSIPYRCLINSNVENVLAAGRNVSCTFEAHASLRVSPCCAALGHAAGVAASISVDKNLKPTMIDSKELRKQLLKEGAVID